MWWGGTEIQQLYVAQDRCGICHVDGTCSWIDGQPDAERLARALREGASQRRWGRVRPRLRVWLSGFHARPFLLEAVEGIDGHAELQALANSRVAEATGLDQACRLWLHKSSTVGEVMAVAMPEALLELLRTVARQSGMKLLSARPWWAGALDEVLASRAGSRLFVAEEHDACTLLAAEGGAWTVADTSFPVAGSLQVDDLIRRLTVGMSATHDQVARVSVAPQAGCGARLWPALVAGSLV